MADLPSYRRTSIVQQIGVPRVDPGPAAAYSQLARQADEVGATAMKDYAQQVQQDAERDGIAQGVARDANGELSFTPREGASVYDRAFNRAGVEAYRAAFSVRATEQANELALQHRDDPEGFKVEWDARRDGALSTMHAELKPYATLKFDELGSQTFTGLLRAREQRIFEQNGRNLEAEAKILGDKYENIFGAGGALQDGGASPMLRATKEEFERNLTTRVQAGYMTPAQADLERRDLYVVRAKKAAYGFAFEREFQDAQAKGGYEQAILRTGALVDKVLADPELKTDEKFAISSMLRNQLNLRTEAALRAENEHNRRETEAASARQAQLTIAAEDARLSGDTEKLRRIANESFELARKSGPRTWDTFFRTYTQISKVADAEEQAAIDAKLRPTIDALGGEKTRPEARGTSPGEQALAQRGLTAGEVADAAALVPQASPGAQSSFRTALAGFAKEVNDTAQRAAEAQLALDVLRDPQGVVTSKEQANFLYRSMIGQKQGQPVDTGDFAVSGVRSALSGYDFNNAATIGDFISRRMAHIPDDYDAMMTAKAASMDAQSIKDGLENYRSLDIVHRAKLASAPFWQAMNDVAQDAGEESLIKLAVETRRQLANPKEAQQVETRWGQQIDALLPKLAGKVYDANAGIFSNFALWNSGPSAVAPSPAFDAAVRREAIRLLAGNDALGAERAIDTAIGQLSGEWRLSRWGRQDRKWAMEYQPPDEPIVGGEETVRESVYRFVQDGIERNVLHIPGETRESFDLQKAVSEDRFVIRRNRDRGGYSVVLFDEMGRALPVTDISGEGRVWTPDYADTLPYRQKAQSEIEAKRQGIDPLTKGLEQLDATLRYWGRRANTGGPFGERPPHEAPGFLERQVKGVKEMIDLDRAKP